MLSNISFKTLMILYGVVGVFSTLAVLYFTIQMGTGLSALLAMIGGISITCAIVTGIIAIFESK